ncbi:30S ribosomal protein S3 [Candidatus Cytomitobacter indipagum]|uniref:Small ribosomal subunit protein uS3 n=1 Tax=Candidatus Cytomitobacter indipagum TaxID=2601575 RepID=A0A5C0UDY2_9PROT|nr:30S ribosomal protein S3 [Candidatus Cytomitobacter indipagum]QEK38285.1 30S ribosomal protein S3 [Candidatus Cytomitobacter indipagum]
MGNKVPLFNLWGKNYLSNWFCPYSKYSGNVIEDYKIRSLLNSMDKAYRWDMSSVHITRISNNIHIEIRAARPGIIIGKSGKDLEMLKSRISSVLPIRTELKIQVNPVKKPEIDAKCLAKKIAFDISKGKQYKFLIKKYIAEAMRFGIKGIKIICSGRLGGVEIARKFALAQGSVPRHTIRADIDYSLAVAETNSGLCGIKVWVHKGARKDNTDATT